MSERAISCLCDPLADMPSRLRLRLSRKSSMEAKDTEGPRTLLTDIPGTFFLH